MARMKPKLFALTALAYLVVTFVTAILWHLVAFRGFYDRIGYFGEEEPIVALGFATIAVQGRMVDYPIYYRAKALVALAANANKTDSGVHS